MSMLAWIRRRSAAGRLYALVRPPAIAALLACAAVAAMPAGAAGMGKTLRTAFRVAETGFDPAQVADVYSNDIIRNIFDSLLTYDYLAEPARLVPNVAEAMPEVDDNATRYVFRLRKGIYFTPDPAFGGKPRELVAADYIYSFKRLLDPAVRSPNAYMLEGKLAGAAALVKQAEQTGKFDYDQPIEGLRALDRYTLQITLTRPDHKFLMFLATVNLGAVAREVVEAVGHSGIMARPVGTGPYMLKSWVRGSKIVLEANPGYRREHYSASAGTDPGLRAIAAAMHGKILPQIGRIEVSIIEEPQAMWLAFLQGHLDIIVLPYAFASTAIPGGRLPPDLAAQGIRHHRKVAPGTFYFLFNMDDSLIGGYTSERIALRRAIGMAYDVRQEIDLIYHGQAVPAQSLISPGVAGYDPSFRSGRRHEPVLARRLLHHFGYVDRDGDGYRETPDGQRLEIRKGSTPSSQDQESDELWKKSMDAIGIRISFTKQKWPDLLKAARLGKLPMWNVGWAAQIPDADTYLQLLYGPNKQDGNNIARFDLPEYNRLYEAAQLLPDSPERNALYRDMALLVLAYAPWHPTVHRIDNHLAYPQVMGFNPHPYLTNAWKYLDIGASHKAGATQEQ
jgi:ABC-type transport system substrate-binding protein